MYSYICTVLFLSLVLFHTINFLANNNWCACDGLQLQSAFLWSSDLRSDPWNNHTYLLPRMFQMIGSLIGTIKLITFIFNKQRNMRKNYEKKQNMETLK